VPNVTYFGYIGAQNLTYVGHATVLLDLGGVRLLTDPVLRPRVMHLRRQGPAPAPPQGLDAVLISHLHMDHLDLGSLRMLGDVRVVAPAGAGQFLHAQGLNDVIEVAAGESVEIGSVTARATPAVHDGRRRPLGGPVADPIGFDLRWGDRRAYFAGDTAPFDGMAELGDGLDLALLPVSGWGPKMGPGHLDPGEAAEVAALLAPRLAVPIHWGTYFPTGLAWRHPELLTAPPREFAAQVAELAPEVDVRTVEPGGSLSL